MKSLIFVTLNNGPYGDHWIGDLCTLLQSEETAGYRKLCWYGQNRGKRDCYVGPGTIVAMREKADVKAFTLIGTVAQIKCIEKQQGRVSGMYELLVEVSASPQVIPRDDATDFYTHWTVLRTVGISTTDAQPQGIYAER